MANIETIYRARIDFEIDDPDVLDAITSRAFDFEKDVEVEAFMGNPACSPYLTAEGQNMKAVAAWAGKVERYINRRKGATLESSP